MRLHVIRVPHHLLDLAPSYLPFIHKSLATLTSLLFLKCALPQGLSTCHSLYPESSSLR